MSLRYLFGPVSGTFSQNKLQTPRSQGVCLTFGNDEADLIVDPNEDWQAFRDKWPEGFQPDFVALWLPYTTLPGWVLSCPIPVVALAGDWNLLYHGYRFVLPHVDAVLTDEPGVKTLTRSGLERVLPANLFGCDPQDLQDQLGHDGRDIDILFVGNLGRAVQHERLPWLARLAALADKYSVQITTGVFGEAYRSLMRRARVVFNKSIRGEANQRVFETLAAGALLFNEAGNPEVEQLLTAGKEYVAYTGEDLEGQLEHYLQHDDQRRAVAGAGFARAGEFTFLKLWQQALDRLEPIWPEIQQHSQQRHPLDEETSLTCRTWAALAATNVDRRVGTDLKSACEDSPDSALLHSLYGAYLGRVAQALPPSEREPAPILEATRRALECSQGHPLAAVNHIELLFATKQHGPAVALAYRALDRIDGLTADDPLLGSIPHLPIQFDHFRVAWEKAAWQHAGSPEKTLRAKCELLRWRLHMLLAEMQAATEKGLVHQYEAVLARPGLSSSRAALGCALGRNGQPQQAAAHLRRAVESSPFERAAPRALHQALRESGKQHQARALIEQQKLLHRAAPRMVGEEEWFSNPAPTGNELVSIVVLCCNEEKISRTCLESLLRHTTGPYELILVDNGSTDATPELLEEVAGRQGPARVEIVRNEENVGFPAGCNQGVAKARGEFVVFLNNDTVVTPHWLEGMLRWAAHRWPQVGMVGAVTNYAPDPQRVDPDYADLGGLDEFARRRRREFKDKALEFPRLSGFCLLTRRQVLDEVGTYDEQFGLGFFDDDDLCIRVRNQGYALLIAQDVYIHHFGSRTFRSLGVDTTRQLQANFAAFRQKWGEEHARHYVPIGPATAGPDSGQAGEFGLQGRDAAFAPVVVDTLSASLDTPPQSVSLCMIVKDEEGNLEACLESARGLFDETIVVDTGSTDRTKEIAHSFGAKVVDFPWCDSFSAARNACLDHAGSDWIFWLDADDRIDAADRPGLADLFSRLRPEVRGYSMKCVCLPPPGANAPTVVDHVRLFPNHPKVRWEHRVHEQILPALRRLGGAVEFTPLAVHHTGYQDRELRKRKLRRDLRLLHMEREEMPEHPFTLFNLASVYRELGRHDEALPLLHKSLKLSHPQDSIYSKLYALAAGCHRELEQPELALAAAEEGLRHSPQDAELLFVKALLLRDRGDLHPARATLEQLLSGRAAAEFRSIDAGIRTYKGRHNLAVVLRDLGENDLAERHWREALSENPDFLPAWLGLGELQLMLGRAEEVERIAERVETGLGNALEAAILRGRSKLTQKDYPAARRQFETLTEEHPGLVAGWVFLSHVLLQEGADPEAAERVLRTILELDPAHREARQNLGVLLANSGASGEGD